MDLLKHLAAKNELSPDDVKLIFRVSKDDIKAWLRSHKEAKDCVNNLQLLMTLHENDQLQITTYLHLFCEDISRIAELILLTATGKRSSSNDCIPTSVENMQVASDVLNILIPHFLQPTSVEKPRKTILAFIESVKEHLPYNRMSLAPFVPYLVHSSYRGVPWHLHDFLVLLVKHICSNLNSKRPSQEEFISCQKEELKKIHTHQQYLFFVEVFKVLTFNESTVLIEWNEQSNRQYPLTNMMLNAAFLHSRNDKCIDWFHNHIDSNFKRALSTGTANAEATTSETVASILTVRHLCLEQIKPQYISYAHWFGNVQMKTKREVECFFSVLSRMVPYEDAMNLKIHINKAPKMPPNCQTTYSDYTQLAKTQLIDMKETTEYFGLFGTTEMEDRLEDVRKVLAQFRQTREVPPILDKACVFRHEYFRAIFLRDLIAYRAHEGEEESQRQLVEALKEKGKLPAALYEEWSRRRET